MLMVCSAAFKILFANVLRVATLNSLGTFVLFLAKVSVVGIVGESIPCIDLFVYFCILRLFK
jgi:hypothetical protein